MVLKSLKLLTLHIVMLLGLSAHGALHADRNSQETQPHKKGIRAFFASYLERYPVLKYTPLVIILPLAYGLSRLSTRHGNGQVGQAAAESFAGQGPAVPQQVPPALLPNQKRNSDNFALTESKHGNGRGGQRNIHSVGSVMSVGKTGGKKKKPARTKKKAGQKDKEEIDYVLKGVQQAVASASPWQLAFGQKAGQGGAGFSGDFFVPASEETPSVEDPVQLMVPPPRVISPVLRAPQVRPESPKQRSMSPVAPHAFGEGLPSQVDLDAMQITVSEESDEELDDEKDEDVSKLTDLGARDLTMALAVHARERKGLQKGKHQKAPKKAKSGNSSPVQQD